MGENVESSRSGTGAAVAFAALLTLLLVAGGWLLLREAEPPARPVLFPPVSAAGDATYLIAGLADPNADVTVAVKNSGLPDVSVRSDALGHFQTEVTLPKPNRYSVTARVKAAKGPLGAASLPVTFEYREGVHYQPVSRNVVALVSFRRVRFYVEVVLPTDSEQAKALFRKGGAQGFPDFLKGVFSAKADDGNTSEFKVNDLGLSAFFQNVEPQVSVSPGVVVVRALSNPEAERLHRANFFQKIIRDELRAEPQPRAAGGVGDIYAVVVRDYKVGLFDPTPHWSDGGAAVWTSGGEAALPDQAEEEAAEQGPEGEEVDEEGEGARGEQECGAAGRYTVCLEYFPLESPASLLRLSRLSPFEVIPAHSDPTSSPYLNAALGVNIWWANLGVALLFVIPVVWAGVVLRGERGLGPVLYLLLAAAVVSPVLLCANNLSSVIHELAGAPEERQATDWAFLIPAVLLVPLGFARFLLPFTVVAYRGRWLRWLLMPLAGVCGAAAFGLLVYTTLAVVSAGWLHDSSNWQAVAAAVAGLFFPLLYVAVGSAVAGGGVGRFARARRWWEWAGLLLLSAVLAYPLEPPAKGDTALVLIPYYLRSFFSNVTALTPYMLLAVVLSVLKRGDGGPPESRLRLAALLFGCYVVGSTAHWFLIPAPLLLSLWVLPRFVLRPPGECVSLDTARASILSSRAGWLKAVPSAERRGAVRDALKKLSENFGAGEIKSKEEFEKQRAEIEKLLAPERADGGEQAGADEARLALNFGPLGTRWQDGVWASKVGLLLASPFLALSLWELLQGAPEGPHERLYLLSRALIQSANWAAAGFFFGYFFPDLRGDTGLRKGIYVALAVCACLLPVWLTAQPNPAAVLLRAGQTVIFFSALGLCAFDYFTLRSELGERFEWRRLLDVQSVPSLAAAASLAIAGAGGAVNSVLTGEFKLLLGQALELSLRQIPDVLFR